MSGDLSRMFGLTPVADPPPDPDDHLTTEQPTPAEDAAQATSVATPPGEQPPAESDPQAGEGPPKRRSTARTRPPRSQPQPAPGDTTSDGGPRRPKSTAQVTHLTPAADPHPTRHDRSDTPPERVRPASAASTGGRVQIMMYAPDALYERFRREAADTGLSYGQLALKCVDQTYDELLRVFAERAGSTGRFFSTNYTPRSREKTNKVPVNLHLLQRDLAVIDDLWQQLDGCRSRNDFLSTAAQTYLADVDST